MILTRLLCYIGLHAPYELARCGRVLALRCHRCPWAGTGWDKGAA